MRCYYPLVGYTPTDVPRPDQYGRLKSCKNSSGPLGATNPAGLEGPTGPTGPGLEIFGATTFGQYLLYNGSTWGVAGNPVALGESSGQTGQGPFAVAVGINAGQYYQGAYSVAVGYNAGYTGQGSQAISIGEQAGKYYQSGGSVAIGYNAAENYQGIGSIAIGDSAGTFYQNSGSVAIGKFAGSSTQSYNCVAIGRGAGQFSQNAYGIAIGNIAGAQSQGSYSVAIGYNASNNGATGSVALGYNASCTQSNTVVLGTTAETVVCPGPIHPTTVVPPPSTSYLGGTYVYPGPTGGWPTQIASSGSSGTNTLIGTFTIDNVNLAYGTYLLVATISTISTQLNLAGYLYFSISNSGNSPVTTGNTGEYLLVTIPSSPNSGNVMFTRVLSQYTSLNNVYYIYLQTFGSMIYYPSGWHLTLTRIG